MMNLKLVIWECDELVELIQFLVEADTHLEAIRKAIEANLQMGFYEECKSYICDPATYTVKDVTFNLLTEIFKYTEWVGIYGEAIVLND